LPHFAAALISSQIRPQFFAIKEKDQLKTNRLNLQGIQPCRNSLSEANRFKSVILSEAPEKAIQNKTLWRGVEGSRGCILCHADTRRSLENVVCLLLVIC
jgi:hypothetical protein